MLKIIAFALPFWQRWAASEADRARCAITTPISTSQSVFTEPCGSTIAW